MFFSRIEINPCGKNAKQCNDFALPGWKKKKAKSLHEGRRANTKGANFEKGVDGVSTHSFVLFYEDL